MQLIFSRKGFDSANGRIPSAIMPDGRLCWFPIPSSHGKVRYSDLRFGASQAYDIISDLSKGSISGSDTCHLDPDISFSYLSRPGHWQPCFGQVGSAQAHLEHNGIAPGDLFIFFGWFRRIERALCGHWSYVPAEPDLHVIFGWLQVGRIFDVSREIGVIPRACMSHAHVVDHAMYGDPSSNNTIYVASKTLELPGVRTPLPGGGVFPRYQRSLQLTAAGKTRGVWQLPSWALPNSGKPPLSYHSDATRWRKNEAGVLLRTVSRGQEFILDLDSYPEAEGWVRGLFRAATDPE